MKFQSDKELFDYVEKKLYTAALSDIVDGCGYRNQTMHHRIRPIHPDYIIVGRAKTILRQNIYEAREENPYEGEIAAIDSLKPGEVAVHSTDLTLYGAAWGELFSIAAKNRGARGTIIDGSCRDVRKIYDVEFPAFAVGFKPTDSNGRNIVVDMDCTIMCGEVMVHPGELVMADFDGVIVVPKEIEGEVVNKAIEKAGTESRCKKELLEGKLLGEIWEKYGVL